MNVIFFPENKLAASVCPIYNGHTAVVTANTDRLKDAKHELAEIGLFRHDIQGTSFLNPDGAGGENANYAALLTGVKQSGRIDFGLYFRTDQWVSPGGVTQVIPDYYGTTWTAAGAAVFSGAVAGQPKAARFPNHGQQLYDISGGQFGYDFSTRKYGASGGSEINLHIQRQRQYFSDLAGLNISAVSYQNGQTGGNLMLLPHVLAGRNSSYSHAGQGAIEYAGLTRAQLISRPSTTRAWDAVNAGQFPDHAASLAYMQGQIQTAINAGSWFSDFLHWHSIYELPELGDPAYFGQYFGAINSAIGGADVWRAGQQEAIDYLFLRDSIARVGSFEHAGAVHVFARFRDVQTGDSLGISNAIDPALISVPLSIRINLAGTALAGQQIVCRQAQSIRRVSGDEWIVNVLPSQYRDGFLHAVIEAGEGDYYNPARPVLSVAGSIVTAGQPCRWVIWSKLSADPDTAYRVDTRIHTPATSVTVSKSAGRSYVVGAITASRHSAAVDL